MKGAIVFLIVFAIFLVVSLGYSGIPTGRQVYSMLGIPETNYLVLGVPATTLIIAVLNGIIFGIIAWIIFTVAVRFRKTKSKQKEIKEK
jgi:hypothetical protein